MPIIKDQSEVVAEIAALTVTATGLATAAHPLPVRDHADDLASLEALESFIAQRQVTMRLHSPQPRQAASPASVPLSRLTPASPGAMSRVAGAKISPAVRLTATQRAQAALRQTAAKPGLATVPPSTATARCQAAREGNSVAVVKPAPITASDRCRAAKIAAPAKVAAPAAVKSNPNAPAVAPAKSFAALAATHAALIESISDALQLQGELRRLGVAFPRPAATTGNEAADLAASKAYNVVLFDLAADAQAAERATKASAKAAAQPKRKTVMFSVDPKTGNQVATIS